MAAARAAGAEAVVTCTARLRLTPRLNTPCVSQCIAPSHPPSLQRVRGQGLTLADVNSIIENLTTEGIVYSTIDEYHFKLTGA